MPELEIFGSSRARARCRSCHRPIEWATVVASGKAIPLDVPVTVRSAHERNGRMIEVIDTTVSTSHFATCPDAAAWRRQSSSKGARS